MPEILTGLKIEDFAHPDDLKAVKTLSKTPGIDKLTTFIEDNINQMEFNVRCLGSYVRLTDDIAPRAYKILRHTCQILDFDTVPEIFSTRDYSIDIEIGGVQRLIMKVPDAILRTFDDSLLYYVFGRVITRYKSGYMKYFVASELLINGTEA